MQNCNKSALVFGVALASISSVAMAEDKMSVYGQANLSLDSSSVSNGASTNLVGRKEGAEIVSNASRFGLKGSLGTSLADTSMIYQLEAAFNAAGNNGDGATEGNSIFAREAYAGLSNKAWGKVRMGRITVGYKSSYTGVDPWTDHVLQARQAGQQGASNLNANYFNNTFEYVSPKFGGVEFNAHYSTLSDDSKNNPLHNSGKVGELAGGTASGLGVKYVPSKSLRLTADVLTLDSENDLGATNDTKAKNGTATQITGRYSFAGGTTIGALFEDATDVQLGTNIFAVVSHKLGKNGLVTLSYGINEGGTDNAYGAEDATTIGVGGKYMLTKNAALIAGWSKFERDDIDASTFTIGIDAKFGS